MKFTLLKSKDDFSYEHYSNSPLNKKTGFEGTAGEALQDESGNLVLFVDPRYHIQADIQTKGKNVRVVKMEGQWGFVTYLKNFLPEGSTLFFPAKSTTYKMYEKMKKELCNIKIEPYLTEYEPIEGEEKYPVFSVPISIAGKDILWKLKKTKLQNALVVNLEEIAYLLNLRSYKTKNTSVFRAKLFIKNENNLVLFTDYKLPKLPDFIEIKKLSEFEGFIKKQKDPIGVDFGSISFYDFSLIKTPIEIIKNPILNLRSKKNSSEIGHYKECFKRLDNALFDFKDKIKAGLSEFELNEIFEKCLIKNGACTTSFKTILAIDENSSIIHYTANSKEKFLTNSSIILLDCGGYYEGGYATDITRVFAVGDIEDEVKEIYTAVLKAQLNVYYSNLNYTDECDLLAKKILKKYEKKGFYFPHGLGHGIGIPVHEAPIVLSQKFRLKFKRGNVFTIEPGLYCENKFGVRLENTVYYDGVDKISLSRFPYETKLINYDMLNKNEKKYLLNWQNGG